MDRQTDRQVLAYKWSHSPYLEDGMFWVLDGEPVQHWKWDIGDDGFLGRYSGWGRVATNGRRGRGWDACR